jgi:LDH2 family malate/lactate/ureidoglycolate dehydrogenase
MALSVAARGKVLLAAKEKRPIPVDWGFDVTGQATTDAERVWNGTVRPVGGHKGYGLALAVGLMAAVLPGAAFGQQVTDLYSVFDRPQNVGHLFWFLDVSRVQDVTRFREQVDAAIDLMHASGKLSGSRVYVPGEIEHESAREQRARGIRYSREVVNEVVSLSNKFGISPPSVIEGRSL